MIVAENIHKSYSGVEVLKGVSLKIDKAEILSIMGASGAGKSTLLHILGTLDTMSPPLGSIEILGERVDEMKGKALASFRNKNMGFVFQFHQLLPEFTALENVCLPAFLAGTSKTDAERKAEGLLDFLGLKDRMSHKPSKLSGGEQQRVSVARALINSPSVVFADEPSGNLDSKSAVHLHDLFLQLRKEFSQTFVIVTHSKSLAKIADRVINMEDGKILD